MQAYGYSLPNNGIFAQPDPFRVMTGITTQLKAQVSITDVGIVVEPFGWVWQVMQPQFVCDSVYSDTTVYNKRGEEVAQQEDAQSVVLYPNPVERGNDLVIEGLPKGSYQFRIVSLTGQVIEQKRLEMSEAATLKLKAPTGISPGIYILTATHGNGGLTFKVEGQGVGGCLRRRRLYLREDGLSVKFLRPLWLRISVPSLCFYVLKPCLGN